MGVAIPDEFRPDMAMAGEWQVTSERIVEPDGERKPEAMALGVRKRIADEEEAEEIEAKKRRWGSTYRSHPAEDEDGDLDALLSNAIRKGKGLAVKIEMKGEVKQEVDEGAKAEPRTEGRASDIPPNDAEKQLGIKRETSEGEAILPAVADADLKQEAEEPGAVGVVFKKRKAKNIRQK
jgi:hypothetical protein